MTARKAIVCGMGLAASMMLVANAEAQYPYAYPYSPAYPPSVLPYIPGAAPPAPQAWSYDPYTSGIGPCPQRRSGSDPPCSEQMPPTYGQPSFWPVR
jgi:hypothetical protein